MKFINRILTLLGPCLLFACIAQAQSTDCPSNMVCVQQDQFNTIMSRLNELVSAREAIAKLVAERTQSDAVIASAEKVIADFKEIDDIHQIQIAKYKDVVTLYEKVINMYVSLLEKTEAKLNAPKSAWQKLIATLKTIATIIVGVGIGRGL